jgi:hypothetical protein
VGAEDDRVAEDGSWMMMTSPASMTCPPMNPTPPPTRE